MTELRCVLLFGSWKEMTGLSLRSQTLRPLCAVEARMCAVLLRGEGEGEGEGYGQGEGEGQGQGQGHGQGQGRGRG